jgi:lipopolysaccharide transport system ATP-binding protein
VDEVLAVGDAAFQQKCLGKMEDVSKEGRTVLFVSHNMAAVASLTNQCIELTKGVLTKVGISSEVIQHYLLSCAMQSNNEGCFDLTIAERPLQKVNPKTAMVTFSKASCVDKNGHSRLIYQEGERITVHVYINVRLKVDSLEIHMGITNMLEVKVFSALSDLMDATLQPGLYKISIDIDPNYLRPGDYFGGLSLYTPSLQDGVKNAINFRIEPSSEGDKNANWSYHSLGVVRFPYQWSQPTKMKGD